MSGPRQLKDFYNVGTIIDAFRRRCAQARTSMCSPAVPRPYRFREDHALSIDAQRHVLPHVDHNELQERSCGPRSPVQYQTATLRRWRCWRPWRRAPSLSSPIFPPSGPWSVTVRTDSSSRRTTPVHWRPALNRPMPTMSSRPRHGLQPSMGRRSRQLEHAVAWTAGERGRSGGSISARSPRGSTSVPAPLVLARRGPGRRARVRPRLVRLRRARCPATDLGVLTAGLTTFALLGLFGDGGATWIVTRYAGADPAATWPAYLGRHSGPTDRGAPDRSRSGAGVRRRFCTTSRPGRWRSARRSRWRRL